MSWRYAQTVLSLVGTVTVTWAGIELMLTHLIIWHHMKQRVIPKKGLPRMLANQLEYMKTHIERDSYFDAETVAKLTDIRLRIAILNEFRISLIHGALHQRNRRTTDWHTHSIKIDGLSWRTIKRHFSNDDLTENARKISQLSGEISPFFAGIVGIPHPANSR